MRMIPKQENPPNKVMVYGYLRKSPGIQKNIFKKHKAYKQSTEDKEKSLKRLQNVASSPVGLI